MCIVLKKVVTFVVFLRPGSRPEKKRISYPVLLFSICLENRIETEDVSGPLRVLANMENEEINADLRTEVPKLVSLSRRRRVS